VNEFRKQREKNQTKKYTSQTGWFIPWNEGKENVLNW